MTTGGIPSDSNATDTKPTFDGEIQQNETLPSGGGGIPADHSEGHISSFPQTRSIGIRRQRRENSGMIQVTSTASSIWRGEVVSDITFHIKVDACFLVPPTNSEVEGGSPHRFELNACLEGVYYDDEGNREYAQKDGAFDHAEITFTKNDPEQHGDGDDGSVVAVTTDRYHTINARIDQDLFADGEVFVLRVDSVPVGEDHDEWDDCIFGRSEPITVADHALFIEEHFSHMKSVEPMEDDDGGDDSTFLWYSKSAGGGSGLDVEIHLKDASGLVTPWILESPLHLKTELVYDDGSPCPLWPIDGKKAIPDCDGNEQQRQRIYRPLVHDDPAIHLAETSCPFSFRIEEVSYHHHGHNGFKLKVSSRDGDGDAIPVHPAILGETIIVKSKQKIEGRSKKRTIKDVAVAATDIGAVVPSLEETNKKIQRRKVSEDEITPEDLADLEDLLADDDAIPVHPAIIGETIVVKSKQKSEGRSKKCNINDVAVATIDTAAVIPSLEETSERIKLRRVSEDDISPEDLKHLLADSPSSCFGKGHTFSFSDDGAAGNLLGAIDGFVESVFEHDIDLVDLSTEEGAYSKLLLAV